MPAQRGEYRIFNSRRPVNIPANPFTPSMFNSKLVELRRSTMGGVYDVHTNAMQYPQIMQPTHCRWERVPPADLNTDMSSLTLTNEGPITTENPPPTSTEPTTPGDTTDEKRTAIFPPVPSRITDHYVVQDIVYESPPYSNIGIPGPDGDLRNIHPNGLASIANPSHPEFMSPEIIGLLPDDCKESLIEAAAREVEWKSKWSTEAENGARSRPLKSYAWYP